MAIAMQYGSRGLVSNQSSTNVLFKGTIDDSNSVTLELPAGGIFELFTAEYNASTDAYRGHRLIIIKTPEESVYGTTACAYANAEASSNSGVTITYNNDSTITLAQSSPTYNVKYVVRTVAMKIGNPTSVVSEAEAARDAAQAAASDASDYADAALASANAAQTASGHYPKVENGYWYVWDTVNNTWMNTNVKATGTTPSFSIGNVTTGAAGTNASASITGTDENPVLNLTIPRGQLGNLIIVSNVTVQTTDWALSGVPISADFTYEATITVNGADASMVPEAVFSADDAMSGNFAPILQSASNAVIIYAKAVPSGAITIPTIMIHVGT